ncbi:hypothetical protein K0U07_03295 [bacterium]|nr:hypothetical protein [bacterium]
MEIREFPSAAELTNNTSDTSITNVTYIGPEKFDRNYLSLPAEVPRKVEIADLEKILDSATARLFEIESTSFVCFAPPPMYALKDLFRGSVLPEINSHEVIAAIDEKGDGEQQRDKDEEEQEEEAILGLAYTILKLEDIHLSIRLAMKSLAKA